MALSPAELAFQEASIEAFRQLAPHCRIGVLPGMRLRVSLTDGRTLSLGLEVPFRAFLDAGGAHDQLGPAAAAHARHAIEALGAAPGASPPGQERLDEAIDRVLPLLEAPAFFEGADEAAPDAPRLLRAPVLGDELALGLVLPGAGRSMRFLSQKDLDRWGKPFELIEHQARQNLEQRTRGRLTLALRHGAVLFVEESPWFQASLALSPSFRRRVGDVLGEGAVLVLPARDRLVAFDPTQHEAWTPLLPELRQRHDRDPNPLSDMLFVCGEAGLTGKGRLPRAS